MGTLMANTNNNLFFGTVYSPDGTPTPELLTEQEVICFLRLDIDGPENPARTLKHYRDKGLLHSTRIGKTNRYSKTELLKFIDIMTDRKKRLSA